MLDKKLFKVVEKKKNQIISFVVSGVQMEPVIIMSRMERFVH